MRKGQSMRLSATKVYGFAAGIIVFFVFLVSFYIWVACPGSDCGIVQSGGDHWKAFKIALVVCLGLAPVFVFTDYCEENPKENVKITFEAFRNTYLINPDAWVLPDCSSYWAYGTSKYLRYVIIPTKDRWMGADVYDIRFSFVDWMKMIGWSGQEAIREKKKEKQERLQKENEDLAAILTAMQADVNRAIEKFSKEIKTP